ncbi:putative alpha/beta hydrolase [Mycolicibacter minnesotensis]
MSRPNLQHLNVDDLVAQAGGDPWAIDDSLQAGSPTQINFLAQAFHSAAGSATAAEESFRTAQEHFTQYNRESGEQPINNGAEVQRVKDSLHATNEQLGQIAADLETIAAALAQARATSRGNIKSLNENLETADYLIGHYLDLESQGLDRDADIEDVRRAAKADTETALHNETFFRNDYSKTLKQALTNLRVKDGYDPDVAVRKFDAEGEPAAGNGAPGTASPTNGTPNGHADDGAGQTPPAGGTPTGADGGAGGNGGANGQAPGTPDGKAGDGGAGAAPPWVPPGTPVMVPGSLPPPTPPTQINGKWGNVGDGLAAAGERANVPANVGRFVPGGSPSAAIPGGVPMGTALETVEKFGKRLGVAGNVVTGVNGIVEGFNDVSNGAALSTTLVDVGAKTAGDIGGGLVGASTGAEAGAFIGSLIAPGPGTVIGAGVGAVVGGVIGSEIGKKMGEEISDVSHSVWRSLFG